ncbi:MAG: hypothetical protein OXI87_04890 [Albidovulum sp.]|nr:hypothetical protein [Albidovulum sp.]
MGIADFLIHDRREIVSDSMRPGRIAPSEGKWAISDAMRVVRPVVPPALPEFWSSSVGGVPIALH